MFDKVLVANRGEIACRVMRSCRRLGLRSVAVYSDADAGARHVREADEAVCIGPARAADSYLNAAAVLQAARERGAQAIHPGYGFLSERLELIDACAAAGITFIGPHREAIAAMGSKIESKRLAHAAGIACVPGYDGDEQQAERLRQEALRIGLPLLIKASAGGGGKGMRRVERIEDFDAALALARAEAHAAFGDDRVLLERCILRPRHLEVQLLGDRHGGLVHLFERECSIQRHYQKLIEESPAPHLQPRVRERLFDAALALGRRIGYDSAGTVEFVLDADGGEEPWFLEMNTRLQVEHPVTELTTGIDLVEWQIRVAAGEPLGFAQAALRQRGWAIEARINAEAADQGFAPSFGPITGYDAPQREGLRIDSGIDARSVVTPHYDSLLAKVIGWGATRRAATERLRDGLQGLRIEGIETTQPLLLDVIGHRAFDAVLSTDFLPTHFAQGWQANAAQARCARAVAAAAWLWAQQAADERPMQSLCGWRLGAAAGRSGQSHLCIGQGDTAQTLRLRPGGAATQVEDAQGLLSVVREADGLWRCETAPQPWRATVSGDTVALWSAGAATRLQVGLQVAAAAAAAGAAGDTSHQVSVGLPGVLSQLLVAPGDEVEAGAPLAVLEAMKLFHTLTAPRGGRIRALPVAVGTTVGKGAVVVELEP